MHAGEWLLESKRRGKVSVEKRHGTLQLNSIVGKASDVAVLEQ
jgi:hypothetical protein